MDSSLKPSRRKFLKQSFAGLCAATGIDAMLIEPNWYEVNRATIPITGLPKEFEGYKIGLFSDIHYPRFITRDQVQKVVGILNGFRPDVVAIPGDFVAQRHAIDDVPDMTGLFDGLHAPDGVFATLGNHDHWVSKEMVRAQLHWNTPIRLIEHRSQIIERGSGQLAIAGTGDLWCGAVNLEDSLDEVPANVPRILLCHNPDVAEISVSKQRVDLMVSGHTHGGQICVPFGGAVRIPSGFGNKFAHGLVDGKRYRVYVTKGVCSVMGTRFWCRPEVSLLTLTRA